MNENLKKKIQELVKKYQQKFVDMRRHLHIHPELSFQEYNTAEYIAKKLEELGIPIQKNIANTGVVATIKGKNPSKQTIALRADIDALPIQEKNKVSYKSRYDGIMHACGHDVHTASLIGVAQILTLLQNHFEGTVRCIFQPAEEELPGGAIAMIREGVLENPTPTFIFGQHVDPSIPVGKVGFVSGQCTASADTILLTVKGKGGHAAMPEKNVDPVIISAHIIVALQQIVSRYANPQIPSVLSFGKVLAHGATNVIPNEVHLEGTFRTLDEKWRIVAHQKITQMVQGIASAMGGSCELTITKGYPSLYNAPALTQRTKEHAIAFLSKDSVLDVTPSMGGEDFSYYAQKIDACFYFLGVQNNQRNINAYLHTPTFNIDEEALGIGVGLMAWLTLKELAISPS